MTRTKLPVIDGDCGNGDIYGYATTERGALRVANRYYADLAVKAERMAGPIKLRDGSTIGAAFIALTEYALA